MTDSVRTANPARPGGGAVVLITPGASPVDALARGLASLAEPGFGGLPAERLTQGIRENPERYARLAGRGDEPPAIIVDQLEEIFTAGAGETGRQEFVAALAATWEHSRAGRLTVSDYQASGGIRDAISRTAEHAYATLGAGEQEVARQLFLRLVHIGDDGRATRARLPRTDLPGDATVAAGVLERFVGQRLITMDRDEAEITHEALLGAWPRLRGWIDADREDIRIRLFRLSPRPEPSRERPTPGRLLVSCAR